MVHSFGDRIARIECERGDLGGCGGLSHWNGNIDIGSCRGLTFVSHCKRGLGPAMWAGKDQHTISVV